MESDVLDDAVALVEEPEDGDPLAHRRYAGLIDAWRSRGVGNDRPRCILFVATAPAGREREDNQHRCGKPVHAYSGIHGS
jgi:hypothetical protein